MRTDQLLSLFSPILPIVFFFLFKPKKDKKVLWVVFFYVVFLLSQDLFVLVIKLNHIQLGSGPGFFFSFFDFVFVSSILYLLFANRITKTVLAVTSVVFLVGIVLLHFLGNEESNSAVDPIELVLILPFCIIYLFEQLNRPDQLNLYSSSGFWIILGFFIFISGTLFLHIYRIFDADEAKRWWPINNVCNIIYNSLLALAFYINYHNAKSKNPPRKRQLA